MSVQKCRFETRVVAMSDRDGLDLAARWFDLTPEQVEAQCGKVSRGQHKGQLRGWIVYRRCTEGGWAYGIGGVIRPDMIFAAFCPTFDEMGETRGCTFGEFYSRAMRVDTAYGYDRKAAVAKQQAEYAALQEENRKKDEERAFSAYCFALDVFEENENRRATKEEKALLRQAAYAPYQTAVL